MNSSLEIIIKSAIIDNVVFIQYLAICPLIMMTDDTSKVFKMSVATFLITLFSTAIAWPLYNYIILPYHLEYMQLFVFALIILLLIKLSEHNLRIFDNSMAKDMCYYVSLLTVNSAVLGITMNAIGNNYAYGKTLDYTFGSCLGFFISLILMAGIRNRLRTANVPKSFRGVPILYVTASLLSLAFVGFKGLIG